MKERRVFLVTETRTNHTKEQNVQNGNNYDYYMSQSRKKQDKNNHERASHFYVYSSNNGAEPREKRKMTEYKR